MTQMGKYFFRRKSTGIPVIGGICVNLCPVINCQELPFVLRSKLMDQKKFNFRQDQVVAEMPRVIENQT
jgi:hypothetical protein